MVGLTIGEKHTYNDFGLKMLSFNVSSPEIYEEKVDVPGRNGPLDMSEALTGEPVYQNRKMVSVFDMNEPDLEMFRTRMSKIRNAWHGKYLSIMDDKDPGYYYEGRVSVDYTEKNPLFYEITISADINPFKLKVEATTVSATVSGETTVICENERMSVVPTITMDADFTLTFGDITIPADAGTHIFPDIKFTEGTNEIICSGYGNITFTYQEGAL